MGLTIEKFNSSQKTITTQNNINGKGFIRVDVYQSGLPDTHIRQLLSNEYDIIGLNTVIINGLISDGDLLYVSVSSDGSGLDSVPDAYETIIDNLSSIINLENKLDVLVPAIPKIELVIDNENVYQGLNKIGTNTVLENAIINVDSISEEINIIGQNLSSNPEFSDGILFLAMNVDGTNGLIAIGEDEYIQNGLYEIGKQNSDVKESLLLITPSVANIIATFNTDTITGINTIASNSQVEQGLVELSSQNVRDSLYNLASEGYADVVAGLEATGTLEVSRALGKIGETVYSAMYTVNALSAMGENVETNPIISALEHFGDPANSLDYQGLYRIGSDYELREGLKDVYNTYNDIVTKHNTVVEQAGIVNTRTLETLQYMENAEDYAKDALSYANDADTYKDEALVIKNDTQTIYDNTVAVLETATNVGYNQSAIDARINALAPNSGYTRVSKKLDNFVFQESSNFINKVADKNRYVKFGEKVVDTYGPELVTNGDFSDGTTGWSVGTNVVVNSMLKLTSPWATYTKASTGIKTYTVSFYVVADSNNLAHFWVGSSLLTSNYLNKSSINKTGRYTYTFTATGTWYISLANASGIVYFDNISVREIQTAQFQVPEVAEIITNGSNTTSVAVNAGDYVVVQKVDNTDHTATTFRAKQDAPIGTALTNTTYFEDRTSLGVTNQALAYHAYNTLTNSYEGIKTEVLFSDVSKEDLLDNPTWLARNGFSKVSQYLYSKGEYNDLVSGQYTTLNKGLFHPMLNIMGTRKASDDKYWYDTTVSFTSVADCFDDSKLLLASGNVASGKSGRPTGDETPYYDVCYPSLYQDIREYAKLLNRDEVELIRDDKEENGVEEIVTTYGTTVKGTIIYDASLGIYFDTTYSFDSVTPNEDDIGGNITDKIGYVIGNDGTPYITYSMFLTGTANRTVMRVLPTYGDISSNISIGNTVLYTRVRPILTSNTKLSIDLIANPANYPQVLKDRLSSGVGVVGINPLLVSDTGDSYIFTTPGGKVIKFKDKIVTPLIALLSYTSGATWNTEIFNVNSILNTETLSYVYGDGTETCIYFYTSKNLPYIQTTSADYELQSEDNFVYTSNNHDVTLGIPNLINNVTGKVSTGTDGIEKLAITKEVNGIIYQTAKTATVDATIQKVTLTGDNGTYAGLRCDVGDTATIDTTDTNIYILPLNGETK